MKNIRLAGLVGLLCIFLLAGCGNKARDNSISGSDNSGNVSQSQEMTTEQLHQYFQQAFGTKGNALDTLEQLALEVAEIEALAADANLPDDYEEQYREWRAEEIHTMLENLHSQYDEIIAGLSVGSGAIPGACYAEQVDFDGDGLPELFVLSLEQMPNYDGPDAGLGFALELYQSDEGQVLKLGEEHITTWNYESVEICKTGTASAVHVWHYWGRVDDGADDYYGIKDGKFQALDRITRSDTDREAEQCTYTENETLISMTDYNNIQAKYTAPKAIASFEYTTPSIKDRGILPEPSTDVLRRAAMVEALRNTSGLKYAKLIDTNKDSIEELVVLYELENQDYGNKHYFRVFSWNDKELHAVDLNKAPDQEITNYLELGFDEYGIHKKKDSGNIYMKYSGEIAGGWGGTLFINGTDFKFYDEPFFPSDPESDYDGDWETDYKKYEADLNQYEAIEEISLWQNDYTSTIEAVRQSLIKG